MHRLTLVLVALLFLVPALHAQSATDNQTAAQNVNPPKLPFADQGACPFECCQYGGWTATSSVVARTLPDTKSPVVFAIRSKETVRAITGAVVTTKYGLVKVLEPIKAWTRDPATKEVSGGDIKMPAGALLYLLHSEGEGSDSFWYNGGVYSAELYADSVSKGNKDFPWDVLSLPEWDWWAKVRNSEGLIGWVFNPANKFDGMDACGG